jgi:hypothetical protein
MSICTKELNQPCRDELLRIIGRISQQELTRLLATEPAFKTGGFRSRKPELLRKRLEQIVLGSSKISGLTRNVLAAHSRSATLLTHLSVETIAATASAWAALLGDGTFLTAALLDPRTELRDKAEKWLERTPHFATPAPQAALSELTELFSDIFELLGAEKSATPPPTRESREEQREKLGQRIKALQTENRRLKGVDDKRRRSETLLTKATEQIKSLEAKLKSKQSELRRYHRELEDVKKELQRETTRREQRLQAALDLRLAREFHGWLAEARSLEATALGPVDAQDVAKRARAALKIQAAIDRHSGNRLKLEERLENLTSLRQKVENTLKNAIRQAPELKLALAQLNDEIHHLQMQLNIESELSPLERILLNQIHSVPEELLPRLKTLLKELNSLQLLDRSAVKTLNQELSKRFGAIEALGVAVDPDMEKRHDALALLGRALAGKMLAVLLLDGHNVLFGLQARYMPPRGKAVPDREKREKLVSDVVRITHPNPAMRAITLFDGATRSDSNPSPNVRVIYSGGEGEHRADKVLIDQIRFLKSVDADAAVLLVSNDKDLCREARRLGAKDIAVADFGAFL